MSMIYDIVRNMKMDKPRKKITHDEVFKTICDTCHKPCDVPFKPNGKKPVFCDACFRHTKEAAPSDYVKRKDKTIFNTPHNFVQPLNPLSSTYAPSAEVKIAELKRELSSANAKLDKLIDMFSKLKDK
jgi:CxxC-x17-CxxC domain-containing protein